MSLIIAMLLVATPCFAAAESEDSASIVIGDPIPLTDMTPDLEPAQFAKAHGVDYAGLLQKAMRKDADALTKFLMRTSKLLWDGAYGELHSMVVLHLLLRWGDVDFARAIAELDSDTKDYLAKEFRQQKHFVLSFPDTASRLGIDQ
jgi:hypothetical protein